MWAEDILCTVLTVIVYALANCFTYMKGTSCKDVPLNDVMHDVLPNWSGMVHVRDVVLGIFLIPFLFVKDKSIFIKELWGCFMIVVMIKAVCIFFTQMPSSHPGCFEKRYLNHCYHNSISGHASLCLLLAVLYKKDGLFDNKIYIFVTMYCILILLTRAHYSVDIITSVIITYLICEWLQ